jgi:hypothetical protein
MSGALSGEELAQRVAQFAAASKERNPLGFKLAPAGGAAFGTRRVWQPVGLELRTRAGERRGGRHVPQYCERPGLGRAGLGAQLRTLPRH